MFVLCADSEGGGGGHWNPLKNHKNIGFLSNTGPDFLKNKLAFNLGRLNGVSLGCR